MRVRNRIGRLVLAAGLVVLVVGAYQLRRGYIRAIFLDGPGDAAAPALTVPIGMEGSGLSRVERVRVALLDGLGLETAREMPHYSAMCERGHDLVVDVGFPTVSLPVQHVMWTGLTQSQSGVMFRGKGQIVRNPRPAPAHGIPAQVTGSAVVAESHQYIVHALGFDTVEPPHQTEVPDGWTERDFLPAATAQVSGDAPLVFVHILRVDVAGHRHGGVDSPAYRETSEQADAMLGALVEAERAAHATGTRWFVIADHNHRGGGVYGPAGGHGGATRSIRRVRGCIAGQLDRALSTTPMIHMVDFARAIADSLGVTLTERSAGRPLYAAIEAPVQDDATLPSPSLARWLVAAMIALLGLIVTGWATRGRLALLPWWWPVALLSIMLLEATPSMSVPMIYRPLGRIVYVTGLPGLLVLAVLATLALRELGAIRAIIAQLAIPMCAALVTAVLSGGATFFTLMLGGAASEPPLMPSYTAYTSVFIVLAYAGAVVCAAGLGVTALAPSWFRRGHAGER